jgi:transcriptional regulator with XRE-family HTH domain
MLFVTKGSKIRDLRMLNGYTQTELAKKIGVSTQLIFKYEKEIVTNIPIGTIEKLSNVFGVSPGYIMEWNTNESIMDTKMSETRKSMIDIIMALPEKDLSHVYEILKIVSACGKNK